MVAIKKVIIPNSKYIYWEVKCDCGIIKNIIKGSLTPKGVKSCGCLKLEQIHHMFAAITKYKNPSDRTALIVYKNHYNDGDISIEEFKILSNKNCFYCNIKPSNIRNSALTDPKALKERANLYEFIYNGLDRIDSLKPHNKDNVVTCCKWCNFAKQNSNIIDFKNKLIDIIDFRKSNYNSRFINIKIPTIAPLTFNKKEKANPVSNAKIGDKLGKLTILSFFKDKYIPKCSVKCECGTIKNVLKYDLFGGKTRSCNGGDCRGQVSPYISTAKAAHRSHYSEIKFEEFMVLSQMNCFYCNRWINK